MDERETGAPVAQPETKEPTTEVPVGRTDGSAHETLERLAQRSIPDYVPADPVGPSRTMATSEAGAVKAPAMSERATRTARAISVDKVGPYLTMEQLSAVQQDDRVSKNVKRYADAASWDVERNGNDALAHLVLPSRVYTALRHRSFTITTLREALKSGAIHGIPNVRGRGALGAITSALAAYDRDLAARAAEQPPKPADETIP